MIWALPAASVLDEVLDFVGIALSSTAAGSALGITVAVLGRRPLGEIEEMGFRGTAGGLIVGTLVAASLLAFEG